jgi:hypothetical protein
MALQHGALHRIDRAPTRGGTQDDIGHDGDMRPLPLIQVGTDPVAQLAVLAQPVQAREPGNDQ